MKKRSGLIIGMLLVLVVVTLMLSLKREKPQGDFLIRLLITSNRSVLDIPLEDYLVGVVLAEMPASFEFEALKAQAVCARTFTLKKHFSATSHETEASICDDIRHCQAFITTTAYLIRYPDHEWAVDKVRQAVLATRGEVITIEGQLVEPVYHSTCGGHTESSQTVWGHDHCYLQGVPCLWDSGSPYHRKVLNMSITEFRESLNLNPESSIIPQQMQSTENGTVAQIAWGKKIMTGQQVRQALKLPSARFTIALEGDTVAVTTTGNGHGVGLCQYGAHGMAKQGKNYQEILHYYYQAITLYKVQY